MTVNDMSNSHSDFFTNLEGRNHGPHHKVREKEGTEHRRRESGGGASNDGEAEKQEPNRTSGVVVEVGNKLTNKCRVTLARKAF